MRHTEFANDEYYHIYNRGVDKRAVFLGEEDYGRFLIGMKEFNRKDVIGSLYEKYLREKKMTEIERKNGSSTSIMEVELPFFPLVEIICYCLNPNHYHLILKQSEEKGIEKFMHKLGTSYTKYFNHKYSRSGSLFQGRYKSIHIDSNDYLLYLSAYLNANNFIHGYSEKPDDWAYSSYLDYVDKRAGKLCKKEIILAQFDHNFSEYEKYITDNALQLREKKEIEKYILE